MWQVMVALAVTPGEFDDRVRSVANLDLERTLYRKIEEPLTWKEGPMSVTLTEGVLVPVFSGRFAGDWRRNSGKLLRRLRDEDKEATLPDAEQRGSRELVGFVWVDGKGTVELELPDRADAMILANRQVVHNGADPADLASVASGDAPFRTTADRGLFLSNDPRIDRFFLGDAEADPFEVVVYEDPGDLDGARLLLEQRLEMWEDLGYDWEEIIAADRQRTEPTVLVDLQTDTRWRHITDLPNGAPDRWLAAATDPRGHAFTRWETVVLSAGRAPGGSATTGRVSGIPFPPLDASDPTSIRLSPLAPERVNASVEVTVEHKNHATLEARIEARITLKTTVETPFIELQLPKIEARENGFVLESVTWNDQPVVDPARIGVGKKTIKREEVEGEKEDVVEIEPNEVRVIFPEPLPAGERVKLVVVWRDAWPWENRGNCGSTEAARNLGLTTGLQTFLPHVRGTTHGGPWTYRLKVDLPDDDKMVLAASGDTTSDEVIDGRRIVKVNKAVRTRWPSLSIGKFHRIIDPAAEGMPSVRAHMLQAFPGQLESMAPEARRVISYYQGWMPDFPVAELDVVEGPPKCGGFVWRAPHGMFEVQRARVAGGSGMRGAPKLENAVFAHEIAHQYWGQVAQPASLDDRWMVESFAEFFSCMYVAAAFEKPKFCSMRMTDKRKAWESKEFKDARWSASLSGAFYGPFQSGSVYEYGPYVLGEMLRPRVSTEKFFMALDILLRNHPGEGLTSERMQAYMEKSSGQELGDFFDFWVHQGMIPGIAGTWEAAKKGVKVELTSTVPFGTFDVPVRVSDDKGEAVAWVKIVDGKGSAVIGDRKFKKPKVELDPAHRVIASSRKLKAR